MRPAHARYGQPDPEAELVQRHATLLDRCARRLSARTGHAIAPEDLWSAGALGLLEAARRFDGSRDVRFETFAEHRIRGAMLDEMRRMDHLPRRLRSDTDRVDGARRALAQSLGREPSLEEVAGALGAEVGEVAELLMLLQPSVPMEDEAHAAAAARADDALESAHLRHEVARAIAELPDRLQVLLALYYDEELTYREIAKVLGVSEPRVCQLHSDAVKRLRAALERPEREDS